MADRFLIGAGGTWDTAASDIWAAGSGGAADGGGIGAAEDAILDANSGNLDVTAYVVCGSFNTTGYTGTVDAGAGGGGAGGISVAGDLLIVDGTLTQNGVWSQTASGNIRNATAGNAFGHIKLAMGVGVTSTLTGAIQALEVTLGPGTTTGAAQSLLFRPTGDDKWHQTPGASGAFTINNVTWAGAGSGTMGPFDFSGLNGVVTLYPGTTDNTITAIGNWVGGSVDLKIYNVTDTKYTKLAMGAYGLTCGDVLLGGAAISKGGGQFAAGTGQHKVRNINVQAVGDAAEDLLDFGNATLYVTGTIEGAGIDTFQNTGGVVIGGTVDNVDLTGQGELLHINPVAGAGNTNVRQVNLPRNPARSLARAK